MKQIINVKSAFVYTCLQIQSKKTVFKVPLQVLNSQFLRWTTMQVILTQVGLTVLEDAVDNNDKHSLCCVFGLQLLGCYCKATQLSKCIF